MTSAGRFGRASPDGSSFGRASIRGSATLRLIQSANASYSAVRTFCWMRAAPDDPPPPIWISPRIFDFSGVFRSISPWSRSDWKVCSADGRM